MPDQELEPHRGAGQPREEQPVGPICVAGRVWMPRVTGLTPIIEETTGREQPQA